MGDEVGEVSRVSPLKCYENFLLYANVTTQPASLFKINLLVVLLNRFAKYNKEF